MGRSLPDQEARDNAVAAARVELHRGRSSELTCREWVDRFLARYEREHKTSSYDTMKAALGPFTAEFGDRPLGSITRIEAMDWTEKVSMAMVPRVVTLFGAGSTRS